MSEHIDACLAKNALTMAFESRNPEPGLIHHSDRGVQYASQLYQQALTAHGAVCSMSRKGNCLDNAVCESFFHTLKVECVYTQEFATREEARGAIFEFIEVFYNQKRRHSTLGYLSPVVEYERMALAA